MSSLFQALETHCSIKRSSSKSFHQHCSFPQIKILEECQEKDKKLSQFSQSSSSQDYLKQKGKVEKVIGKACLELSQKESFVFYLIKWQNKKIKESTWVISKNVWVPYCKIKSYNDNIYPQFLPHFNKDYKFVVPNYQQILENCLLKFIEKEIGQKYSLQTKQFISKISSQEKKYQFHSYFKKTQKTKKIMKIEKNQSEQSKIHQFSKSTKNFHMTNNKIKQKNCFEKRIYIQSNYITNPKIKKEQIQKDKINKEKERLDQNIQKYFQQSKRNQKVTKLNTNQDQITETDLISNSSIFSKGSICQNYQKSQLGTSKSTNYERQGIQDFIFLSDTYQEQSLEVNQFEEKKDSDTEELQLVQKLYFVKDQQELQPGEMIFDRYSLLYSKFIEIQEGQFTDVDFRNLTVDPFTGLFQKEREMDVKNKNKK